MGPTSAPTLPLAAKRPTAPPRPAPSRTPYRPAPDTQFSGALRSAIAEASAARYANPNAARIAAPVESGPVSTPATGLPGAGLPNVGAPPLANVDARLWASMTRSYPVSPASAGGAHPVQPGQGGGPGVQVDPAAQALSPAAIRERGQAFLASIKGSDQTAVGEYESVAQARAWGYSTCSAASLTAVLRAAGQDVKIADVMKEMPGGMTIALGLVSRPSLVNAANHFGARASDDVRSYEALKAATDNGQPVLVDIRNSRFPEGHWIVVTGVDENGIRCADSSRYDLTSISRSEFQRSWSSRGIRLEGLNLGVRQAGATTAAPGRATVPSA